MKKTTKHLKLSRVTVRRLSGRSLEGVRGGGVVDYGDTVSAGCPASWDCIGQYTGACVQTNRCAAGA